MFVVVDLETTGLNPSCAEILTADFVHLDYDLNQIDKRSYKIRPRIWDKSAQDASAIHGISREEAFSFMPYKQAAKEMYENPIVNATLSALPVSGELMAAEDIGNELSAGNYGKAGLYTVLATLPGGAKGIKALKALKAIPEGPQAKALREAEEYGQKMLGLPPGNTPMERAKAMGKLK